MSWRGPLFAVVVALLAAGAFCQQFEVPDWAGMRWYKGNTNCHTNLNIMGGDSTPAETAGWYKEHGYHFVFITDAVQQVSGQPGPVDLGDALSVADASFVVIPGVSVTWSHAGKYSSVGALDAPRVIFRQMGDTLVDTLQRNVSAVREAGAVPVVVHPNYHFFLTQEALLAVDGCSLLEVYSGDPMANNEGLAGSPSVEQMWDALLTAGRRVFGLAADAARVFKSGGGALMTAAYPGTGWVVVRARSLDAGEITRSLERGLFYASTGVVLDDIVVEARRIEVRIKPQQGAGYTTEFIGAGGKVLSRTTANPAAYRLARGEKYVRAKVTDSAKRRAWVQPVFVRQ